jgi:Family of unknown function (DUF5998)
MSPMRDASTLPTDLRTAINRAGYYPELLADVVDVALGGEPVLSHLVHQETTFDADAVRRHATVLVLTAGRLIVAHADDHTADAGVAATPEVTAVASAFATAATESVPLSAVHSVVVNHVVEHPDSYQAGQLGRELTVTLGWGAVSRLDLEPATCGDPDCDADHGYTGTATADDISLRVSADADGEAALREALVFTRMLSAATAAARGNGSAALR